MLISLYSMVFLHQTTTDYFTTASLHPLYSMVFLHQTTTCKSLAANSKRLYSMVFLHQTTTLLQALSATFLLYSMVFLHQTTTTNRANRQIAGCILWFSYIKPQPMSITLVKWFVVFYGFPTSNHNLDVIIEEIEPVVFYGFPTSNHNTTAYSINHIEVVFYGFPTSNHNSKIVLEKSTSLYSMVFLHQTTTLWKISASFICCILWFSYIKPQPFAQTPYRT